MKKLSGSGRKIEMLKGMTGFGSRQAEIARLGRISVELKSTNHKFVETVFHLPEGFISLEDKIKKEIEARVRRGRVTCVISVIGKEAAAVSVNKPLLKKYIYMLRQIKRQFRLEDGIRLDTLMHLPGILSLGEDRTQRAGLWRNLKALINLALDDLVRQRQKEGRALCGYLKNRAGWLNQDLGAIQKRFSKATKEKLETIVTDEERAVFLKNSDITEEIERLSFYIGNFKNKLSKDGPAGKELDFIAQEMQREANTIAAKSFDTAISARVIQIKSQIEKIREQVQNIE